MFWIDGRFSWAVIFAVLYGTVIIVATDIAWRLVNAPLAWIAGAGLTALAAGTVAIILPGARR